MIVTSEPFNLILPKSKTPRGAGLHQSSIIRAVGIEHKLFKADMAEELDLMDYREVTDQVAIARMCAGLAWEEWFIPNQLPDVIDHPGEIEYDGIYMNPDGESLSVFFTPTKHHDVVIHEVKFTWKSTKTVGTFETVDELRKNWMWLAQLKCYCKAKDTRRAKLYVYFPCGNYKFPIRPVMMVFTFQFDQQEIDDNWDFLTDYAAFKLGGK